MSAPFGMPGIGGSLGMCALCGESFLLQILTGEKIRPFQVDGVTNELFAHKPCLKKFHGKLFDQLPPASPLRIAIEKAKEGAAV